MSVALTVLSREARATAGEVDAIFQRGPDNATSMAGSVGITTFIKTELIADGVGRARVPRPGGRLDGLAQGQRVDNDVYQHVRHQRPLRTDGGKAVMKALRNKGLLPVRAQVRANARSAKLTTLVDLVCVKMFDRSLWAIEIKNTTMPLASFRSSFKRPDMYNPRMKNGMEHTDCSSYMLQAAFGALALMETYPSLPSPVGAMVIVATAGAPAAQVYQVPRHVMAWSHFKRRPPVPLKLRMKSAPVGLKRDTCKRQVRKGGGQPKPQASLTWPPKSDGVDKALLRMGLVRMGRKYKNRVVYVMSRVATPGVPAAIAICLPSRLAKCGRAVERKATQLLVGAAKRQLAKFKVKSVSLVGVALDTMTVSSCGAPCTARIL